MFKRSDVFQNCNIFKPLLDNNNYKIITFLCLITIIPNTQQDLEDLKRVGLELGIITMHIYNTYNTNNVIRHVLCTIITYSKMIQHFFCALTSIGNTFLFLKYKLRC